jgi:hypothetical protein
MPRDENGVKVKRFIINGHSVMCSSDLFRYALTHLTIDVIMGKFKTYYTDTLGGAWPIDQHNFDIAMETGRMPNINGIVNPTPRDRKRKATSTVVDPMKHADEVLSLLQQQNDPSDDDDDDDDQRVHFCKQVQELQEFTAFRPLVAFGHNAKAGIGQFIGTTVEGDPKTYFISLVNNVFVEKNVLHEDNWRRQKNGYEFYCPYLHSGEWTYLDPNAFAKKVIDNVVEIICPTHDGEQVDGVNGITQYCLALKNEESGMADLIDNIKQLFDACN